MREKPEEAADKAAAVLQSRPSGLISDIDGTLSPIVTVPSEAVVLPQARQALSELSEEVDLVAVISGRRVDEARHMVGLDHVVYFGNHGLERWDAANGYRNQAAGFEEDLRDVRERLSCELGKNPEVRIEDKGAVLSLHYRGAARAKMTRRLLVSLLERLLPPGKFLVAEGKMVIEVSPALGIDKGTVVRSLVKERDLRGVVFIGDDATDINAMRNLQRLRRAGLQTLSIGVGGREAPDGLADTSDVLLPNPTSIASFLKTLAVKLSASS
jgi:trehalose 6-phosphate phosphatase